MREWLAAVGDEVSGVSLQGQAHSHSSLSFPFLPYSSIWGSGSRRFALQCSFRVIPTHSLHVPSRIDGGELSGVAMLRPSSTEMPAGRGSLVVCLLPRRDAGKLQRKPDGKPYLSLSRVGMVVLLFFLAVSIVKNHCAHPAFGYQCLLGQR